MEPGARDLCTPVQERSNLDTHYPDSIKSDILSFYSVLPGI
jgi:hypothetical protein